MPEETPVAPVEEVVAPVETPEEHHEEAPAEVAPEVAAPEVVA